MRLLFRGPAFAPAGIYGPVKLQAYSSAFIDGAPLTPLCPSCVHSSYAVELAGVLLAVQFIFVAS